METTDTEQAAKVRRVLDMAGRGGITDVLISCDGQTPVVLPQPLARILYDIVTMAGDGRDPIVLAGHQDLSTSQAARILGCSRHSLEQLLADGTLAYSKVGNRRRLRVVDVLDLRRTRERAAAEVAAVARVASSHQNVPTRI